MKRTISAICTLALAAGISASCQKTIEQAQKNGSGSSRLTVTATIADKGTKVTYSEDASSHDLKPTWAVGDTIIGFDNASNTYAYKVASVDNTTGKATLEIVTGSGAGSATADPSDGTKMYMFYAPGKKASDISDQSLTVSLASQGKDVVPALMMASATVSGGSLSLPFENKTAIIGIKTPTMAAASTAYTSIALSGTGINTEVKFAINSSDELEATYQTAGTITKAADFSSDADKKTTATVYIAACPLASAADLTFITNNGEKFTKTSKTMASGNYYYMTPTFAPGLPDGALAGKFTVNADGKQVYFSQGNLQATYSTTGNTYSWGFATNQYAYIGNAAGNTTIDSQTDAVVDLFGWSTASTTYGINTSTSYVTYSGDFVDWGKAIGDGNTWHTLSKDEWTYLFNTRTMTNGKDRYSNAVGGVAIGGITYKGVFLYPDNYNGEVVSSSMSWDAIKTAGIVFLPAAGYRYGSNVTNVGDNGYYWSSSAYGSSAYLVNFDSSDVYPADFGNRIFGYSVRLITECQ